MSFFSLGKDTFKVPMKMHSDNRQRVVQRMIAAGAAKEGVIVVQGGAAGYRDATDHEHLFRQESFFHYLFGVKESECFGAIDIHNNKSILFIPRLPVEYAVWMGKIQPPSYFQELYAVDSVRYADEITSVLKDELKASVLYTLKGKNTDSGNEHLEAKFEGIQDFKVNSDLLYPEIVECRLIKSEDELNLMRYVNRISSEAHMEVMRQAKAGLAEFQCEALFLYETYFKGGCRNQSYTCICASGDNSSVLHYGHAGAPNSKELTDGEMVMFDMGAEYHCYSSDISRSFPVNGKFTEEQKQHYEIVLAAQEAVMKAMKPGVSWFDMHRLANRVICEGLKTHGFLQGDVDEMMKNHIGALFMPHGLGHFLGIDTHDCGGYIKGIERIQEPGIKSLRSGRILQKGMVLTVEPGLYFIEPLLLPAFEDETKKKFLNVEKLRKWIGRGGVRIEDDVIVTENGIENMTTAPRTVKDIEALMSRK